MLENNIVKYLRNRLTFFVVACVRSITAKSHGEGTAKCAMRTEFIAAKAQEILLYIFRLKGIRSCFLKAISWDDYWRD